MLKRISALVLLLFVFTTVFVKAEENDYVIADVSKGVKEVIRSFGDYESAVAAYKHFKDDYSNLVLYKKDEVLRMEYGVVEFKSGDECKLTTNYYSDTMQQEAYLNGCYSADALYLKTTKNDSVVYFMIAGDEGHVDKDSVILRPYELMDVRPSAYRVKDGYLYHDVKSQLDTDFYRFSLLLDYSNLEDGIYYSYDGHYFFKDFYELSDAVINNDYSNAVNNEAYFNYFQYLSHRSKTNYSVKEIENYFNNILGFNGRIYSYKDVNRDSANDCVNYSQLYGNYSAFTTYQDIYGANALMMLGLACNESAYGKSALSFTRNNLFGHAAFDSDVERNASRYRSVSNSVYAHARYYVSGSYANYHSRNYNGTFFGDKAGGMNVMYASDPYWGEKAAANCFSFDQAMGQKDYGNYCLGIINGDKNITFYSDSSLSNIFYKDDVKGVFSLIILEENENSYLVQLDSSFNNDNVYSFDKSQAYVRKDDIDLLLYENAIDLKEYKSVVIDCDGGKIAGESVLRLQVLNTDDLDFVAAEKGGYEFLKYESEDGITYKAKYKEIDHIELYKAFEKVIEYNYRYDLSGGKIKVCYADGSEKIMDISTDMVGPYDNTDASVQTMTISYCGKTVDTEVEVSMDLDSRRNEIIATLSQNYFSESDIKKLKENLELVDYYFNFEEIRNLDNYDSGLSHVIEDNELEMGISGLNFAFSNHSTLFKNIVYVNIGSCHEKSRLIIDNYSKAYGFDEEQSFSLHFQINYQEVEPDYPLVISLKADRDDVVYSVYHLDGDGNIIKCRTKQSKDYVYFIGDESGDYVLLRKDSNNIYDLENDFEHFTNANSEPDHLKSIRDLFGIVVVGLWGCIQIVYDSFIKTRSEDLWKESRKLLQTADCVQEEKPKN